MLKIINKYTPQSTVFRLGTVYRRADTGYLYLCVALETDGRSTRMIDLETGRKYQNHHPVADDTMWEEVAATITITNKQG